MRDTIPIVYIALWLGFNHWFHRIFSSVIWITFKKL